ncbi:hypothetical protein KUH03_01175 [Sphingobacterium sp. E70]|nr:hypothetical protein [Sphingobacterium sp. E70]ULT25652.1 hypothetical protein KUH03_01175 [Sphingobacterium sp. E70]
MGSTDHLSKEHAFKALFDQYKDDVFGYALRFLGRGNYPKNWCRMFL